MTPYPNYWDMLREAFVNIKVKQIEVQANRNAMSLRTRSAGNHADRRGFGGGCAVLAASGSSRSGFLPGVAGLVNTGNETKQAQKSWWNM